MAVTLQTLRIRKEKRRRALRKGLGKIKKQLTRMGALKIIVFGSYAEGSIRGWSDLDLIVVMPSTKTGKEWFREIYDRTDAGVAVDILPFTKQELRMKRETSSFIRHALKTGRVVYEKR